MEISDQIGNIITIILMLLLCIKSKDKKMPLLIAFGATVAFVIYQLNIDIAVYYALNGVLAISLSWLATTKVDTKPAGLYSSLMFSQCILCFILVVDIAPDANYFMQETLELYNDMIYLIIICIGIIASDNFFTRLYYSYARRSD